MIQNLKSKTGAVNQILNWVLGIGRWAFFFPTPCSLLPIT
ncbi:co-chaperonin GroES [Nodularia spumigena CCY9414]|nr:co-chaperonin GroES [Nodularia spumigena CCY9414]EAW46836.1 co-chaperonin GroES [Nodularia spumigena CCY9414]